MKQKTCKTEELKIKSGSLERLKKLVNVQLYQLRIKESIHNINFKRQIITQSIDIIMTVKCYCENFVNMLENYMKQIPRKTKLT